VTAYLVTGVAGSGKTTLRNIFRSRGYQTYDIDEGFAGWVHKETNIPAVEIDEPVEPLNLHHEWRIISGRLENIIRQSHGLTGVFGSAHDLYQYAYLFDAIFLLEYPSEEVLRQRIAQRPAGSYGQEPGELENIIRYWPVYEDNFRKIGAMTIDCTQPSDTVLQTILTQVDPQAKDAL